MNKENKFYLVTAYLMGIWTGICLAIIVWLISG